MTALVHMAWPRSMMVLTAAALNAKSSGASDTALHEIFAEANCAST